MAEATNNLSSGNAYGVKAPVLESNASRTKTYHGAAIVIGNEIVGRIKEWTPGPISRPANLLKEISKSSYGEPIDIIPQSPENYNIAFTRTELWTGSGIKGETELAMGYTRVWEKLTDQRFPFKIEEIIWQGKDIYSRWAYYGCWFVEKSANTWSATGDGIIEVNCQLMYVNRKRII